MRFFVNIVLLQVTLSPQELDTLQKEFPQFLFLSFNELTYKNLTSDQWLRVEIIYGNCLTKEEFSSAPQLRWIHTLTPHLDRLCLENINDRGNVLISLTQDENVLQAGEFAIAGILAFAKNLHYWQECKHSSSMIWNSRKRENMWSLKDRLLLQIGLGKTGTEITRRAKEFEMKIWGVQQKNAFHPYCHQLYTISEIHTLLPCADVVCINLPKTKEYENWFGEKELELMKKDSILIILGFSKIVNEEALIQAAETGKFRGILLDVSYRTPLPKTSKLWSLPNILITPDVAGRPKAKQKESFKMFRYNMRQFVHGNFRGMVNLVDTSEVFV